MEEKSVKMSYPNNIESLHIELTDKCQASCPMCARNINGGPERSFVGKNEISLSQFKTWFSKQWLAGLSNFYACGNYGDPIIAQDCLEIFEYVRSVNFNTRLCIHTNGSARSTDWWKQLASVLGDNHEVVFGIDGFEDTHSLYRRGTSYKKIIENAKSFIDAGGIATIDCLIFEHNQHQIENFQNEMISLGFKKINFKSTGRFYDMQDFPVFDKNGKTEYYLKPANIKSYVKESVISIQKIAENKAVWEQIVKHTTIKPKCVSEKTIYVDARGNILPCCWVGSDWIEEPIEEQFAIQKLRNLLVQDTKSRFIKLQVPNLNVIQCIDMLPQETWNTLAGEWCGEDKASVCVKNCGGFK